jgi:PKD repeat protein
MKQPRKLSAFVAVIFASSVTTSFASGIASPAASSGAPMGGVSVASEPAGATVYIDGKLSGETPYKTDDLSAGDHRVKIVKPGFLENARIVTVASGKTSDLAVNLTVDTQAGAAQKPPAPAKKGGSHTLLWVAGAGGAGAAAVVLLTKGGKAPVVSAPTASTTTQLVGINVMFNVQATDADNDTLTYAWDFGDGLTGSGASPAHVYTTAGTFNVKVTVDDGKGHKVPSTVLAETVKSLAGTWKGTIDFQPGSDSTTAVLTQNGFTIGGNYTDQIGSGSLGGTVNPNGSVSVTVTLPGFQPFTFVGTISGDLNSLTGVVNGSGFVNNPWSMTRQ